MKAESTDELRWPQMFSSVLICVHRWTLPSFVANMAHTLFTQWLPDAETADAETPEVKAGQRLAQRLDRIIWCGLLTLPALALLPYGAAEVWWQAIVEMFVFALGVLWVIEGAASGQWRIGAGRMLWPVMLLALLGVAQIYAPAPVRSADTYETQRFILRWLACGLYLSLLCSYLTNARRLRQAVYVVLGAGLVTALFALARLAMQRTDGFLLPGLSVDSGFGQFINRNHAAFLLEMGFGLAAGIALSISARHRRQRYLYGAVAVLLLLALGLTKSRGGVLAGVGQALLLGLLARDVRRKSRRRTAANATSEARQAQRQFWQRLQRGALALGLALTVAAALLWAGGAALTERFAQTSADVALANDRASNTRRVDIWRATLPMIAANPITGQGLGGYWLAVTKFHDASGEWVPRQAHNDYLELIASGGLLGLLLCVWLVREIIGAARPRLRSPDSYRRAVCLGALVGLAGVALHSLVDFGLHITVNALCAVVLIALATARGQATQVKL